MSRKIYILAPTGENDESFRLKCGHSKIYLSEDKAKDELRDLQDMVIDHYANEEHKKVSPGDGLAVYEVTLATVRRIS